VLGHDRPVSYADFLRQRLEINYFAASCLMPRSAALEFLGAAKRAKDLAIEDFRDAFGVTHEAAAHRFTNLATSELGLPVHFLRVDDDGALARGYENDGVGFATDPTGSIEGQPVCRHWAARVALSRHDRTTEFHQYTDTPRARSGARRRPACPRPVSSPSPSACRSRTRPGSAAGTRSCGRSHAAPTRRAADVPTPRSRSAGATTPGPAHGCTRRSSARCRRARSRGSTTPRSTRSSTATRRRPHRISPADGRPTPTRGVRGAAGPPPARVRQAGRAG
jgi:hypothetical protein